MSDVGPIFLSWCVVCGKLYKPGRTWTCSEACHKKFIDRLVEAFGEFKKVVDVRTGKAYRVPTRYILERGLKYEELPNFPEWEGESATRRYANEEVEGKMKA